MAPGGSLVANAGEGTCKLFVLALWGELGRLPLAPASRKPLILPHLQASWPALGLAPRSPIAHVRGLRLGPGYYGQSQSWEAACRVAVGFETSHEPLPQRQHPLPWP